MNFAQMSRGLRRLRPLARMGRWLQLLRHGQPVFELPECLDKPPGRRVMVVAPHPDDETLGCGGTLYKHHMAGDRVTAVYMTDGGKGDSLARGITGRALVELREQEAREAANALGIRECIFLRHPDSSLQCSSATAAQLRGLLESVRPDVVYAPSPLDTHRDHQQSCAIMAGALADYRAAVKVYLYETWAPVPANCAVPIDLERKIEAVRMYRSQMDERELFVHGTRSLARYRGLTCLPGRDNPVECFLRLDRAAFVRLVHSMT